MLDGLVGRAVLAEADRVVRPDPDDRQAHERGEPDGRPHVVARRSGRSSRTASASAVRRAMPFTIEPIACSRIAEGDVAAGESPAAKTPAPSNSVFVDSTRSAAPPIIVGAKLLERLPSPSGAGVARGHLVLPGRDQLGQRLGPAGFAARRAIARSQSSAACSGYVLRQASKRSLPLVARASWLLVDAGSCARRPPSGTTKCASGSSPMMPPSSRATSSSPSGAPWAFGGVLVALGAG